jgi:4F5 protein related disordered region
MNRRSQNGSIARIAVGSKARLASFFAIGAWWQRAPRCGLAPSSHARRSSGKMGSGGTRGNQRDEARAKNLKNQARESDAAAGCGPLPSALALSSEALTLTTSARSRSRHRTTRTVSPWRSGRSGERSRASGNAARDYSLCSPPSERLRLTPARTLFSDTKAMAEKAAKKAAERAAAGQ